MKICKDFHEALKEVDSYVSHFNGSPLIISADKTADYTEIVSFLRLDNDKTQVRVSDKCMSELPPNPNLLWGQVKDASRTNTVFWLGATQALMLHSQAAVHEFIVNIAGSSVPGPVILVCPYICTMLESIANGFTKLGHWFVTVPSQSRDIPAISLYDDEASCPDKKHYDGMKALLYALEDGNIKSKLSLVSSGKPAWFSASMFPFVKALTPYETLCSNEPGIRLHTNESDGTIDDWKALIAEIKDSTFAELCEKRLGSIKQLAFTFGESINEKENAFLCYIALKVFASDSGTYLAECLSHCKRPDEVQRSIYNTILSVNNTDDVFKLWMKERQRLLDSFDEDHALLQDYCDRATIKGKDVLAYLRDTSEPERVAIIHAICTYNYEADELNRLLSDTAPDLAMYLRNYTFDRFNTKVMDSDSYIHQLLTDYFIAYKRQKLTNKHEEEFLQIVNDEAARRSFLKLQTRAGIVRKMDKAGAAPFFFDAMGVEFMGYIEAKCEQYGMLLDCQIGSCNLPSITSLNKEFYQMFPADSIRKEPRLDETKHEGTVYDYRVTKEPVHIFNELAIIDENLKKFAAWLRNGTYQKIIILSDHGASRLAVTYESENDRLEMPEKGEHSGRCCPAKKNPNIPFAYFEDSNGYVVLGNYERFKGSRKADVETHGGATLEETVVPIITLTAKPKDQQVFFVEDTVRCSPKDGCELKLYANPPLQAPRIIVNEVAHDGSFDGDKHNVRFALTDIRRKGHYEADIFDGGRKVASLAFNTVRATTGNDLF